MTPKSVVLAIYITVFVIGLPANLLACYSFLRKVRQKPVPIDILLLNLTISDLFLLTFLPFKMVEATYDMTWPLPAFLCPFTNFLFYSSIYLSTLFLVAVSAERYLCIAYPVKHKFSRRPTYARLASLIIWLVACSHCASIVFGVEYGYGNQWKPEYSYTCYQNFTPNQLKILLPFRLELSLVLFCLPFIITIFCYINIIRIVTSMPNIKPHKKQRAVGLAVATILNFAIAFAPYNISHIVGFIQGDSPSWRVETFFLTSFNTILDPIIFFFSSATIRETFADCWLAMPHKRPAVPSPCCLNCCKVPEGKTDESVAGQLSASNVPSFLAGSSTPIPSTTQHSTQTLGT
ncbi:free fatty acid receptor 2-like [Elgaria multicarinata webbii]|uniref:free fatty acid receptor 2-like n=1 Tax=Elgaria multicarinata webbii TaxID=159646 RepID=UPI002FCD0984